MDGQAVAAACTAAFQKHKKAGGRAPPAKSSGQRAAPRGASGGGGGANAEKLARMEKMKRMSLKRHEGGHKTVSKLTDEWFAPDMVRSQLVERPICL